MTFLPAFTHLYVEEDAFDLLTAKKLLTRFSRATVVPINNYKEVFNRPRQRWADQRASLKLIIAKRHSDFLYEGSQFVPRFGMTRAYYNTLVLNCLYGCEYCYLQGMFPSANLVVFANNGDFISQTEQRIRDEGSLYLCISYDTDLLALEELLGYCAEWIECARAHPELTIEIRTKSGNFSRIAHVATTPNVILAWTISPDEVIERHEHRTPSLRSRLKAMREAIRLGWNVRLCLDPVIQFHDWQASYQRAVEMTFEAVRGEDLYDVSIGTFRMNSTHLRSMQNHAPASVLLHYPYDVNDGTAMYSKEIRASLLNFIANKVKHYVSENRVWPIDMQ